MITEIEPTTRRAGCDARCVIASTISQLIRVLVVAPAMLLLGCFASFVLILPLSGFLLTGELGTLSVVFFLLVLVMPLFAAQTCSDAIEDLGGKVAWRMGLRFAWEESVRRVATISAAITVLLALVLIGYGFLDRESSMLPFASGIPIEPPMQMSRWFAVVSLVACFLGFVRVLYRELTDVLGIAGHALTGYVRKLA